MKRKFLALLLAVCMVVSLVPVGAFAAEGDAAAAEVEAANLHDTRLDKDDTKADAIADEDLVKDFTVAVADAGEGEAVDGVDKIITMNGADLKAHQNADTPESMGYWVGVAFIAPEGAAKYKVASSSTANNERLPQGFLDRFTNAEAAETVDVKEGKKGYAQYFDLTDIPEANHLYVKIQWLDNEGSALKNEGTEIPAVVYEIKRKVTMVTPTIEAVDFYADGAKANTAAGEIKKALGLEGEVTDSDSDTIMVGIKGTIPGMNYVVKLKGPDGNYYYSCNEDVNGGENIFDVREADAKAYVLRGTFNVDAEGGAYLTDAEGNKPGVKEGEYTFELYSGRKVTSGETTSIVSGDIITSKTINIGKVTVQVSEDDKAPKAAYFNTAENKLTVNDLIPDIADATSEDESLTFVGWIAEADGTAITTEDLKAEVPTASVTYTAKFAVTHTVTFKGNGGTWDSEETKTVNVEAGKALTEEQLPENPVQDGKVFKGWAAAADSTEEADLTAVVTADVIYYAIWDDPSEEILTAGFNWYGEDADLALTDAITNIGKHAEVNDCIDECVWLLVQRGKEAEGALNYWFTVGTGADIVLFEGPIAMTAEQSAYYSYMSFLSHEHNTDKVPQDVMTVDLYELAEAPTEGETPDLTGKTPFKSITIKAGTNPTTVSTPELVMPETEEEKAKIKATFSHKLMGRYNVVLNKDGDQIDVANTDCDRAQEEGADGSFSEMAFELDELLPGTYTVELYARKGGTQEATDNVGDPICISEALVVEGGIKSVTTDSVDIKVSADNENKKIALVGQIIKPEATNTFNVTIVAGTGEEIEKALTVTYDEATKAFACTDKVTILGEEYTVNVEGLEAISPNTEVAAPAPKTEVSDKAAALMKDPELGTEVTNVVTAINSNPAPEGETAKALLDAAKEEATNGITEEAAAALTTEAVTKATDEGITVDGIDDIAPENVVLVTQPSLVVTINNYEKTEEGDVTLTLDVSGMVRTVAYITADTENVDPAEIKVKDDHGVEDAEATAVVVKEPAEVEIPHSITFTVNLPSTFVDLYESAPIWVLHAKNGGHYHEADKGAENNGVVPCIITSDDGLSPFIFKTKATVAATVNGTGYATLKEAIEAAEDGDEIVITTSITEPTTITADTTAAKTLTFKTAEGVTSEELTINGATVTPTEEGVELNVPKKSTGGGTGPVNPNPGPSGGGNGGGSETPSTSHSVKVPATVENGKISVSPTSAKKGTTVTITVTPDEGYELDKLTVTDADGKTITTTGSEGKYTFTMPDSAVNVSATFKKTGTTPWQNPFKDVGDKAWYFNAVKYVNENGLMVGDDKGNFNPSKNLTRAEFAQILFSKEGKPAVTGESKFPDVVATAWYANAINWATQKGILAGYSNGKVGPNDNITREQLASLLWRYEGSPAPSGAALNFKDAGKISGWAKTAMQWAVENGVMKGTDTGMLNPTAPASRADAAQMLMNYFNK